MKTILVASDVQGVRSPAGGVATFVTHFSSILRALGDEVTILMAGYDLPPVDLAWRTYYQAQGIEIITLRVPFPATTTPHVASIRFSEYITPYISNADIVYFQDWGNGGFHLMRSRRFRSGPFPVCVTVLHGASEWITLAAQHYLTTTEELSHEFAERYAARHSDFVLSPSQYMLDWVQQHGWELPSADHVRVMGLPIVAPFIDPDPRYGSRPESEIDPAPTPKKGFNQIIFFGRREIRKGFELFINALLLLKTERPTLVACVQKIVFLGESSLHPASTVGMETDSDLLRRLETADYAVEIIPNLDNTQAQEYLRDHAAVALVVIPSLTDNFPYTVIETSLIPGLNVIYARSGGIPEIFGASSVDNKPDQLFDPIPKALAAKLAEWLERGPIVSESLAHYDYQSANARWSAMHREISAYAESSQRQPTSVAPPESASRKAVDVCIPYYNAGPYLAQALMSLEHQTSQEFGVIVVDDGSTDPESQAVFEQMRLKYAPQGWQFIRQENAGPGAARNTAVRHGTADYLIFLDADDVAALSMVERSLTAMRLSGDDCLAFGMYKFRGEALPYDLHTERITAPSTSIYLPIGSSLAAGLLDPIVFGGAGMIIQRTTFDKLGGFSEIGNTHHLDYELHLRLALDGYRTDVLPEILYFYRTVDGSLSHTGNTYSDLLRITNVYQHYLAQLGLGLLPLTVQGLYSEIGVKSAEIQKLKTELIRAYAVKTTPQTELLEAIKGGLWRVENHQDSRLWDIEHKLDTQLWQIENKLEGGFWQVENKLTATSETNLHTDAFIEHFERLKYQITELIALGETRNAEHVSQQVTEQVERLTHQIAELIAAGETRSAEHVSQQVSEQVERLKHQIAELIAAGETRSAEHVSQQVSEQVERLTRQIAELIALSETRSAEHVSQQVSERFERLTRQIAEINRILTPERIHPVRRVYRAIVPYPLRQRIRRMVISRFVN